MDREDELKAIAEFEKKGKIQRIDNPLEVATPNEEQNAKAFEAAKSRSAQARRAQRKSNTSRVKK